MPSARPVTGYSGAQGKISTQPYESASPVGHTTPYTVTCYHWAEGGHPPLDGVCIPSVHFYKGQSHADQAMDGANHPRHEATTNRDAALASQGEHDGEIITSLGRYEQSNTSPLDGG